MLKDKKIAFIGSGNMAEALIRTLIDSSVFNPDSIICSDLSNKRLKYIHNNYNVSTTPDNVNAVQKADIIILSVKPQVMLTILDQISEAVNSSKLIISIAAGIGLDVIQSALNKDRSRKLRLVRAMPNTPVMAQAGATALSKSEDTPGKDLKAAMEIFNAVGKVVEVAEEMMDAVTGLSGSGPAYVFLILEALADAGVKEGLPRDIAMTLSTQTVLGAAKLASESGEHPGKLKDMVTSPGGTTIAGLHALEQGGLKAVLMNAVAAATKRSKELGEMQKKKTV